MKNTILLTSGQALANIHEAKPLREYMESLTEKFTEEGIIRDYKRGHIPNHKAKP